MPLACRQLVKWGKIRIPPACKNSRYFGHFYQGFRTRYRTRKKADNLKAIFGKMYGIPLNNLAKMLNCRGSSKYWNKDKSHLQKSKEKIRYRMLVLSNTRLWRQNHPHPPRMKDWGVPAKNLGWNNSHLKVKYRFGHQKLVPIESPHSTAKHIYDAY
jgi:hypothetical protein